jgi:hypothetical protein
VESSWLASPIVADGQPDGFKVDVRLSSPHPGSVPRPADRRHIGLYQPSDPHKEGTNDERISSSS